MHDLIIITTINDEPRVLDTDLAKALGMADPRKVRQHIIQANREEMESFGDLLTRSVRSGGRPATAYYLNREQALLVCVLSRTERAKEVRRQLIRLFVDWQDGNLPSAQPAQPQLPEFTNPAEAARAWADQYDARLAAEEQVKLLEPAARVGEMACNRNYSLQRFIRTFPGVNTMQIKKDLQREGYLYRRDGTYRADRHQSQLRGQARNAPYRCALQSLLGAPRGVVCVCG